MLLQFQEVMPESMLENLLNHNLRLHQLLLALFTLQQVHSLLRIHSKQRIHLRTEQQADWLLTRAVVILLCKQMREWRIVQLRDMLF